MSSASAVGAFLAEKNRAYRDGYAARERGEPISTYGASGTYVGPWGHEGWADGWNDADQGRPNRMAPSGTLPNKLQFWGSVALGIGFLVLMSWLYGLR
mgnify:CR=1 FL=1